MSESTSPVLALRYNILSAFEKANESFQARLQAAVEQGRLSPEIELDEQPGIPVAPKISRESRDSASEIWLQVTYRPLEAVPSCQVRFRRIVRLRRQSSDDPNRCEQAVCGERLTGCFGP